VSPDITMLLSRIVSRLAQTTQTVRMSLFAIRSPKVHNLARKGWGIPNQLLETTKTQMMVYRPKHNENMARGQQMQEHVPTYAEALSLSKGFNRSESLLKHAYSVDGVMRYMARKRGEDEEKWGIIGLMHDLDYERFPEHHCKKSREDPPIYSGITCDLCPSSTVPH
jgi:hypothetical protein